MMFGPQTGGSTLLVLRCNEASPSTVELGQTLKGSQRAKARPQPPNNRTKCCDPAVFSLGPVSDIERIGMRFGQTSGTKSYSPMPCRTRNVAEDSPALVTRCARLGFTV